MSGKRRPSGDGLIRKRSDGRWEGRIVVGHKNDGTPMYKSVFGKTQKELMPRLTKLKDYYAGMDMSEESRMTLGEWLTKWLDEYKAPMIRESTVTRYRHMINNHIIPNLGSKIITQVATQDIQKMYNKLKRSGRMEKHKVHGHELSNSMVRAIHMMLHEALDGRFERD